MAARKAAAARRVAAELERSGGDGGGRSRTSTRCIWEEETRIGNSFHLTKMFQCIPAGYCQMVFLLLSLMSPDGTLWFFRLVLLDITDNI